MTRSRDIITGIDIGTATIKVAVVERKENNTGLNILSLTQKKSEGMRRGFIIETTEIAQALRETIITAERNAGVAIERAYLSVQGIGLSAQKTKSGVIPISKADGELTELDIKRAVEKCEEALGSSLTNKKIVHQFQTMIRVDGAPVFGRAIGMRGAKFDAETIFILCLSQHLSDFAKVLEDNNITLDDIVAGPIASSLASSTREEREVGCAILNIGSATTSLVVYEERVPIAVEVFPLGSSRITYDLSIGLQTTLEEAEQTKLSYGKETNNASKKKQENIIESRLNDIFEFTENHLKKINRSGLLPAGIILTGGGASLLEVTDFAKNALKLPAKVGSMPVGKNYFLSITGNTSSLREQAITNSEWSTALGLFIHWLTDNSEGLPITPGKIKHLLRKVLDSLTP